MKRTELKRRKGLDRRAPLTTLRPAPESAGDGQSPPSASGRAPAGTPSARSTLKRGRGFAASPAQQEKARNEPCVVTGQEALYGATIDPAHLCARAQGGCKSALCVVPLRRDLHERLDDPGDPFDLLPYLTRQRVPELQHALGHYQGDLLGLLHRLTGQRHVPEGSGATPPQGRGLTTPPRSPESPEAA